MKNIVEYLIELDKVRDKNVYITIEKKGRPIDDETTISQILKYVKPDNGLIALYLYEQAR